MNTVETCRGGADFARCLVETTSSSSTCSLLRHFPDEHESARRLFELRGGIGFPCPRCTRQTTWLETEAVRITASQCCGHRLDIVAGTWLSRVNLDVQSWVYLLALFANRETPLRLSFVARHFAISQSTARAALVAVRNRIRFLQDIAYCPRRFAKCYVDEYLYYHGKRWRRDPTRGTFVLGFSCPAGLRLVPVGGGRACYPNVLAGMGLATASLTTCNAELVANLARQDLGAARLAEWNMASRDGALVDARARLSAFWPYFKRNMRRGRMSARGEHLNRYLSEYAFRFQERGRPHRIFAKLLGVIEQFR